ncbi:MAG: mannitol-1-phosphate 5-dehydrogenase [Candidatus Hydrogenedentes bacterium]|nr:mannitol-1-phosphate 5-dehydrogenase [Candidatus Hydrogenedentota bacterium]
MRAVHFGAGNIGRGFLGQLYWESGWETTFVDVAEAVVHGLQARGQYPLWLVEEGTIERLIIEHVTALDARDTEAVVAAVATADLVSTAVGAAVLPRIAPALARGFARRVEQSGGPLDVIVCENLLNAGSHLREEVRKHLPEALHGRLDAAMGFVEASVGRMVPVMTDAQRREDPLLVCVESYCELPVDADAFRGPIPDIQHLKPMRNFVAYVERKLFVHNMSHAATAYLGHERGHENIWQAIRDDAVRNEVEGALAESCEALARKHGLDRPALREHAADLVRRYHNRALGDQVARVARDPLRKLGPRDRLIGAARMCLEQDVAPAHMVRVILAALRYTDDADPSASEFQRLLRDHGLPHVLQSVCGLHPGEPLFALLVGHPPSAS